MQVAQAQAERLRTEAQVQTQRMNPIQHQNNPATIVNLSNLVQEQSNTAAFQRNVDLDQELAVQQMEQQNTDN